MNKDELNRVKWLIDYLVDKLIHKSTNVSALQSSSQLFAGNSLQSNNCAVLLKCEKHRFALCSKTVSWTLCEWYGNNKNHHCGTKCSEDQPLMWAWKWRALKIWKIITEDTSANTFISRKAHDEVHFFGEIWRINESLMVT